MSKTIFNDEQLIELKCNPYVKRASNRNITYTNEFKEHFINCYNQGVSPLVIFTDAGFNVDVLGRTRINESSKRWRRQSKRVEGLKDTREGNNRGGRPKTKFATPEERIKHLENKLKYLEAENELLKKLDVLERKAIANAKLKHEKNSK